MSVWGVLVFVFLLPTKILFVNQIKKFIHTHIFNVYSVSNLLDGGKCFEEKWSRARKIVRARMGEGQGGFCPGWSEKTSLRRGSVNRRKWEMSQGAIWKKSISGRRSSECRGLDLRHLDPPWIQREQRRGQWVRVSWGRKESAEAGSGAAGAGLQERSREQQGAVGNLHFLKSWWEMMVVRPGWK